MQSADYPPEVMARFWMKVKPGDNGCWLWTASVRPLTPYGDPGDGYGQIHINGTMRTAHRVAYEMFHGPIPEGLVLDHLCCVPACVNPGHLEAVTVMTNTMRAVSSPASRNALKTECPAGHSLSGTNLYVEPSGKRGCRECRRAAVRRYKKTPAGAQAHRNNEWKRRRRREDV